MMYAISSTKNSVPAAHAYVRQAAFELSRLRRRSFGVDGIDKFNKATVAFAAVANTPFSLPLFHLAPVGMAFNVAPVTDRKRLGDIGLLRLESTAMFFNSGLPAFFRSRALLLTAHTAVFPGAPLTLPAAVVGTPIRFAPLAEAPDSHSPLKSNTFLIRSCDVLCCRAGIFRQQFTSTLAISVNVPSFKHASCQHVNWHQLS
jgi:hypothetical protein